MSTQHAPSAKIRARLDFPVIDTDVHMNDRWSKRSRKGLGALRSGLERWNASLTKGHGVDGEDLVRGTLGERYVNTARRRGRRSSRTSPQPASSRSKTSRRVG